MVEADVIDLTGFSDSEKKASIPRKRKRKDASRSPSPTGLFVVDLSPQKITEELSLSNANVPHVQKEGKLLLPAHVSILGSAAVEIIECNVDQQEYVEYLDYGGPDEPNVTRYFQLEPEQIKAPSIIVCKRCGAKGDHKTNACTILICLTCGVRNEHSTNSCPISKVCFSCGMKGHLNASCPNRGKLADTFQNCDRCHSTIHVTSECPTHWRIYEYLDGDERSKTLESRASKKTFPLGEGGEGYIADDMWCYNCGDNGHWGDDCQSTSFVHDIPDNSSAFANVNVSSGPFFDIEMGKTDRAPREWEIVDGDEDDTKWNDWGGRVPINVGRQAKKKEMIRMRNARQDEFDEDDRFTFLAKPMRGGGENNNNTGNGQKPPSQPKKMRFGTLSVKGAAKAEGLGSGLPDKPTLLGRLSSAPDMGSNKGSRRWKEDDHRKDRTDRDRERRDRGDREQDRARDKHRRREDEKGPRYKGGYSNPHR